MSALTANKVTRATDGTHIGDSRITDDGATDISIDAPFNQIKIGDVDGVGNATLLTVDDDDGTVQISALKVLATSGVAIYLENAASISGETTAPATKQLIGLSADNRVSIDESSIGTKFGSIVFMGGLPTADPHVVGQLWNNAGTVKVSAG